MECKLCGRDFIPVHFNQKLCSPECKHNAKRIVQERYKLTKKGQISKKKWIASKTRKENEEGYRQKPPAKEKARIRSRKYYWRDRDNPEYMEKRREYDKKYIQNNYKQARENNQKATKKYRKTENGKWRAKVYKHQRYNNWAGDIDKEAWMNKLNKLKHRCQICDILLTPETVTIDHIFPLSKGGGNNIENLQPLCRSCNSSKGNRIIE